MDDHVNGPDFNNRDPVAENERITQAKIQVSERERMDVFISLDWLPFAFTLD